MFFPRARTLFHERFPHSQQQPRLKCPSKAKNFILGSRKKNANKKPSF